MARSNLYYIYFKPFNVMTQFSSVDGKTTLGDLLKLKDDVYPVGRLDYDSEGLLILTNDNDLKTIVLDPTFGHKRTYLLQLEGDITDSSIELLEQGVEININGEIYQTLPAEIEKLQTDPIVAPRSIPIRIRENVPTSWIKLKLTEGKNRQARKMAAKVGFPVLRLIRISIGDIDLKDMIPGDITQISKNTIYRLLNIESKISYYTHYKII
jgi:23S rRNA pseudouridine2457 synthase